MSTTAPQRVKATQAARRWIVEHCPPIERYVLESNFATDEKSSQVLGGFMSGVNDNGAHSPNGAGKVRKFAEIVAATVPCGDLSLASAIVAEEWVQARDLLGRNR